MNSSAYETLRRELFGTLSDLVRPLEDEIEESDCLPKDVLIPVLKELRGFGLLLPEQYGGLSLTVSQYLPILSDLSRIHGGLRSFVHAHNSSCHVFSLLANDEQKAALLPLAAVGDRSFGIAMTEPDRGTGADMGTTAARAQDGYTISGRKWLVTNSDWVSHFIVFARTESAGSPVEVSALLVDRDCKGLSVEPLPGTLGVRGLQHGELTFENAVVPMTNLLGKEGQGFELIERSMEISKVFVAATSLGTAAAALDLSLKFARERVTFGKPIGTRQAVQRYLAEMTTDVYALRSMLENIAGKLDAGHRVPAESSACKLFGHEVACRVTDRALLVFGGIGFTRKHPIERMLRDARREYLGRRTANGAISRDREIDAQ